MAPLYLLAIGIPAGDRGAPERLPSHVLLDAGITRSETSVVGSLWAFAIFSSEPVDGSGRVASLPSFRLSGRGVFRPFSTARF